MCINTEWNWIGNQQWDKNSKSEKGDKMDLHLNERTNSARIDDVVSQHKNHHTIIQQLFTTAYASL